MDYRTQLDTDGYLILENFFDQAMIEKFSTELEGNVENADLSKASSFWGNLENFQSIVDLAGEFLVEGSYELEFVRTSNKKNGWRRDFPCDVLPLKTSQSVQMLLCLDALTEENGIRIIENSHVVSDEGALLQKVSREKNWCPEDEIVLSCSAGSIIILHSKIVHAGLANFSNKDRRVIAFSWANLDAGVLDEAASI